MKKCLRDLLPFIVCAAEVAAEKCDCDPEDVLLSTLHMLHNRKVKHEPRKGTPCPCHNSKVYPSICTSACKHWPPKVGEDLMESQKSCPACRSREVETVEFIGSDADKANLEWSYRTCRACGTRWKKYECT